MKQSFTQMNTFAEVCAALGKNEQDYAINPDASNEVNEAMCRKRLLLLSKAAYGDGMPVLTNTKQWKYTPVHIIQKDNDAPFGFRLSFGGYVYDCVYSNLGARPPFPTRADSDHAGMQFTEEFTQWMYYLNETYREFFRPE